MEGPGTMKRVVAAVMVVAVVLIIGFSTRELFRGNLAAAMTPFPFLLALYFLVVVMKGRGR